MPIRCGRNVDCRATPEAGACRLVEAVCSAYQWKRCLWPVRLVVALASRVAPQIDLGSAVGESDLPFASQPSFVVSSLKCKKEAGELHAWRSSCSRESKKGTMPSTSTRRRRRKRKWVRGVTTDSTHPPRATFTGSASEIARTMARKDVSPRGLGSGIRMIQYFINRGGKNLSARRRAELERAKRILQQRAAKQKSAAKKR
jgi:Protein of unknown function (DUF3175)